MLCSAIYYTLPDVSENSKSYNSGLPISLFLDFFFSEDRGTTPPRIVGNYLPVDTLKNSRRLNILLSTVMSFLLYDFSYLPLSFSYIKQTITFSSEAKFRRKWKEFHFCVEKRAEGITEVRFNTSVNLVLRILYLTPSFPKPFSSLENNFSLINFLCFQRGSVTWV